VLILDLWNIEFDQGLCDTTSQAHITHKPNLAGGLGGTTYYLWWTIYTSKLYINND